MNNENEDKCGVAIQAAMSTIESYCGEQGETEVEIDGVKLKVVAPETVMAVMEGPELTRDQRIKAIQESKWGQNLAKGLCEKLLGVSPGQKEHDSCIERVSRKLAEGMVKNSPQEIRHEKREERKSFEKMWG